MIKAYASYFISYLLTNLKEKKELKQIILFGSAAKDEATKQSDIDIFIELKRENKQIKKEIQEILDDFYKSREALLFSSKGINNKIGIITGKLENYPDLKKSIESTGIVLYGNYIPSDISGKKYILFSWDKINKNRGAFLNKIYGFKANNKKYPGLIEELRGKKIGKSSIIIPIESGKEIFELLKKYKVNAKILEIYAEDIWKAEERK